MPELKTLNSILSKLGETEDLILEKLATNQVRIELTKKIKELIKRSSTKGYKTTEVKEMLKRGYSSLRNGKRNNVKIVQWKLKCT